MTDEPDGDIDKERVFKEIEQAIISAAKRNLGEGSRIDVRVDRKSGQLRASVDGQFLTDDQIGELLGRLATQTAKRVIIEKIREAEREWPGNSAGES